jgi:hypothetical protein
MSIVQCSRERLTTQYIFARTKTFEKHHIQGLAILEKGKLLEEREHTLLPWTHMYFESAVNATWRCRSAFLRREDQKEDIRSWLLTLE